jgi:RecB family exonuclease
VHRVLARVWTALHSQAELLTRDAAAVRGVVRASIDAEVNRMRRHATPLGRRLLALESVRLEMRIGELLDCDRARAPFAVESVEAPRTVRLGALALEVKLDRVDRLADGALAVIDYKTGGDAKPSAWSGDRPHLPQVPLYAQAVGAERVAAVAFGVVRAERTCYVGLARDSDAFGGIATLGDRDAPRGYHSWEDLLAAWRARLLALANEYSSGDARLAPDPATACRHCHLAALCRINETPLRAEHMEATGD